MSSRRPQREASFLWPATPCEAFATARLRRALQELTRRVSLSLSLIFFPAQYSMTASCFAKCMDTRYKEGDLNVGENSCVDRCAAKYWQVTGIVGQVRQTNDLATVLLSETLTRLLFFSSRCSPRQMLGGMQQQQQQPR